jgi:hypothetical protein
MALIDGQPAGLFHHGGGSMLCAKMVDLTGAHVSPMKTNERRSQKGLGELLGTHTPTLTPQGGY